jgi:hypothetical protein
MKFEITFIQYIECNPTTKIKLLYIGIVYMTIVTQTASANRVHKASNYITMFDTVLLPYNKIYNNCSNTLCYTYSKNFIYKPHSAYGMVGTTAASYLGRRKRL